MTIVDLSAPIEDSPPELLEALRTEIEYSDHEGGCRDGRAAVRGHARPAAGRRGLGDREIRRLGTHNSTHVDAPWHYNSRIRGEPAQTIDELPLEWFFGARRRDRRDRQGRRRDGRRRGRRGRAGERRPHARAAATSCWCGPAATRFYGELDYIARGPAVTAEATRWLFERGVRVMGIDAWGWDGPLHIQAEAARAAGRPGRVLGGPPGRPALLADRAPVQPGALPADGLPGRVLPAEDRGRERRAGTRRRDRPGPTSCLASPLPVRYRRNG